MTTAAPTEVTPEQYAELQAQVDQLHAALKGLGAAVIPPSEPRFTNIYGLLRELAARTLGGDVLHEFYALADTLEAADDGSKPVEASAAADPAPPEPAAVEEPAGSSFAGQHY